MNSPHSPSDPSSKESAAHKLLANSGPIPEGTCFREGNFLVVAGTSSPLFALLDRCIKTNEPTTERCVVTVPFGAVSYRSINVPLGKMWWKVRYTFFGTSAGAVALGAMMCVPMTQTGA